MPRLIIIDRLGELLCDTRCDAGYTLPEIQDLARREARACAGRHGAVTWRIAGDDGREMAAGEAAATPRPGLLPVDTPVLYCEADAGGAELAVYGTVRSIRAGYYHIAADHIDSGGRPVPIGALAEISVPLDTPACGATRTLEAVQLAHQMAAE